MKPTGMIKKAMMVLALLFAGMLPAQSADYTTAVGLRGGWTSGLTIKHFVSGNSAVEGIISAWPHGLSVTGLVEQHTDVITPRLNFYAGIGGHVRVFPNYYRYPRGYPYWYYDETFGSGLGIGLDGVIGLEYTLPVIPMAVSLDFKPFIEVGTAGYLLVAPDAGLGIKVAF